MKAQLFFIATTFSLLSSGIFAQDKEPTPHIEVTGTARLDIMPDEIYVAITIREREEGKQTITVEQQENDLKKGLQSISISLDNLFLVLSLFYLK